MQPIVIVTAKRTPRICKSLIVGLCEGRLATRVLYFVHRLRYHNLACVRMMFTPRLFSSDLYFATLGTSITPFGFYAIFLPLRRSR